MNFGGKVYKNLAGSSSRPTPQGESVQQPMKGNHIHFGPKVNQKIRPI